MWLCNGLFHDPLSHTLSFQPVTSSPNHTAESSPHSLDAATLPDRSATSSEIHLTHEECEFTFNPPSTQTFFGPSALRKLQQMKWRDVQLLSHHIFMRNNLTWTQFKSYSTLNKSHFNLLLNIYSRYDVQPHKWNMGLVMLQLPAGRSRDLLQAHQK